MKQNLSYKPLIFLLLLLSGVDSHARISGRCLDAQTGETVSGVSIRIDGTSVALSGPFGFFEIAIDTTISAFFFHPEYQTTQQELVPGTANRVLLIPGTRVLNEVTISAPLMVAKRREVPGSLSLWISDPLNLELEPGQILPHSPGIVWQQGALNTGRLTIRGIGSRSPYATTRIRAYLDDIPLTTGDGNTTIEDLEMFDMARVEIIRGPASSLYGNGLGGAIVFHPDHTVAGPANVKALLQKGSFDQSKTALTAGFKSHASVLKTTASYTQTDGFRENSHYQRFNGSVMYRAQWDNHSLYFSGNYISLNAQIPSSLDEETYLATPQKAAANWLSIRGYEKYDKWVSGLTLQSRLNAKLRNKLTLFVLHNNAYESRPFNILDDHSLTTGIRDELTLTTPKWALTTGGELFNEHYTWQQIETLDGREGAIEAHNREVRRFVNLFAKADYDLNPHWKLSGSANLHFLNYSLNDLLEEGPNLSGEYDYEPILSPRLGLNGALNNHLNLFAAVGHGFSVPSVEETLMPEGNINPNLLPEEGLNSEAGIRGTGRNQRLSFDVTAYLIRLKNLLVTKRESEAVFYGINAGKTVHYGLEIELKNQWPLSKSPSSRVEVELAHTQMRNRFDSFLDDGQDYGGNRLPGIPNQLTHLVFTTILRNNFSGRIVWTHTGDQYLNDANTIKYKGHSLLNLQISATLKNNATWNWLVQAGINNLCDAHYASMLLVNAPSFGGRAPRYYYPGTPRNAFVSLIIKARSP